MTSIMRIWASACLLLCLPASASATGLFGVTHPTLACGDDAILRSLSDRAITAQQSPAWRKTLFRQGDCHLVTPDIRWEKIANRNGLPLMRRVPPVPGLPPLYFMTGDIAPLAPTLAGPSPMIAERHALPTPPVAAPQAAPPESTLPDETPKTHVVPPVIVQHADTPLPTDLFFMTRGFQKLGSLILTLMLAGGAGWIAILVLRTIWRMTHRRRAIHQCMELTKRHRPMLARWYQQAQADGSQAQTAWETHVERFSHATLIPALTRSGRNASWPDIRRTVQAHVTTVAASPQPGAQANTTAPGFYHQDMNQEEYAAFCSQWIGKAGWETHPPVATGLGSVIQGHRNDLKMLVHCWMDRKPVHEDVILQGIKEKTDSKADIGAIVSNAPYTQEALLLGKKHRVFLLHHEDIFKFVSGIEVPDVA
ncbi:restriction endonuclease [Komagataeibacter medellinensis]|nr:restriction endonuclease [Komagataeibacter medellinensis]